MTKLQEYFHTDWNAMTGTDWFGLVLTVVVFIIIAFVYIWALNPKNKDQNRITSHHAFRRK
ncbi:MAG: cbb3-type cytochrome c oxidase subunit 3 [Gammaproteobacteria bacterium]|nr:cbb3-type cytochrome c oxidase subunit 3 [Gammaproteobacteria bacterium]